MRKPKDPLKTLQSLVAQHGIKRVVELLSQVELKAHNFVVADGAKRGYQYDYTCHKANAEHLQHCVSLVND